MSRPAPPPKAADEAPGRAALQRVRSIETLRDAYAAWREVKLEHAQAQAEHQRARERLEARGRFVLGAVRAAAAPTVASTGGELTRQGLDDYLRSAEQQLREAERALAAQVATAESSFAEVFEQIQAELRARVERYLPVARPRLVMHLRPAGAERRIIHVERLHDDMPVLLLFLLTGKLASRYEFLIDDSTEDVSLPPAPLYAEEGVAPQQVRASATALESLLAASPVLPIKGWIPLQVDTGVGQLFFRLVQRGPVLEAELREGEAFRNLLTPQEAEQLAGHLLRLKLEGKVELEFQAD